MVDPSKYNGIGMTSLRTRQRLLDRLKKQGISDASVLDAMLNTPRHMFVDEALSHRAYEDTALPIGHQQTISQPYIVARITELIMEMKPIRVMDVGTGCGYQAAVLSALVPEVVSVERIKPLHDKARQLLRQLGLKNVHCAFADAIAFAPDVLYDGIVVAAAANDVPQGLIDKLNVGGRLVLPVGDSRFQNLVVIDKTEDGLKMQEIEAVKFVPLLSGTTT